MNLQLTHLERLRRVTWSDLGIQMGYVGHLPQHLTLVSVVHSIIRSFMRAFLQRRVASRDQLLEC